MFDGDDDDDEDDDDGVVVGMMKESSDPTQVETNAPLTNFEIVSRKGLGFRVWG